MYHSNDRRIYVTYGKQDKLMTKELLEAAKIAEEIPQGASIGMKPNLVIADTPEYGATTHMGIVEGIIEYLQDHGRTDISIMEGSWVGDSTQRAFSICGYPEISRKYNVPLYDLKRDSTETLQTPVGPLKVCSRALHTDYLISLPVLKGHGQTVMTCALKNSKGCIPDTEKRHFHTMGLHRPIAALGTVLKPSLFVVDSICGDLNFEEGGNPVYTNRMMLGHDPVQMDAYGCQLMGIDTDDVEYIGYAEDMGVGSMQINEEDIVYLKEPSAAPKYPKPTGMVSRLTRNVTQDSACSACYGNLVHALYHMDDMGMTFKKPICIGQGFKDKEVNGIGIGRCCKNAAVNVPGCPPDAKSIMDILMKNR